MRHRALTIGVMIAALGTAGIAQAKPGHGNGHGHDHGNGHGHGYHDSGHDHHGDDHDHHDHRGGDYHDDHRDWHKGGHIADHYYRDDRYWVRDWHSRRLPEPPHGHRWLDIDGDYVLAAVATGVITAIVLGH